MDPHHPFFVLHRDLPREGPGDRSSTAQALFAVPNLRYRPRILDLGCGPGAQTIDLARLLPDAEMTALDLHPPFLDELTRRATDAGVADRITVCQGDLAAPPVDGPFDLIWAEGSAYIAGFAHVLAHWPALLVPGGSIALTEPVQLTRELPPSVRAVWAYPDLRSIDERRAQIANAGLVLHSHFLLDPETAWRPYYDPLQERIHALRPQADERLRSVLDEAQLEIDTFWAHPQAVGYAFFVFGLPEPDAEA